MRYYATIAPLLLPYLAGRPVNLHRFPDGVDRQGFWQKELPAHAPEWVHAVARRRTPARTTTEWHVLVDGVPPSRGWPTSAPSSCTRGRRLPEVRRPDLGADRHRPGDEDDVGRGARAGPAAPHRAGAPRRRGLPKVTGQRGIQIWVPVAPGLHLRRHARLGGEGVAGGRRAPCPSWSAGSGARTERGGRARLDYTQNAVNKTLVAPYSARPRAGGAGVGADRRGTSSTTRTWRRTAGRVRDVPDRIREVGRPARPADRSRAETPFPVAFAASGWPPISPSGSDARRERRPLRGRRAARRAGPVARAATGACWRPGRARRRHLRTPLR